jgi:hypothetical protein
MRDPAVELLLAGAREHGLPEAEVLQAWEEMKKKHRLPFYVEPSLEARDGALTLSPAVDINLLSRLDRELPGWENIRGPVWPDKAKAP